MTHVRLFLSSFLFFFCSFILCIVKFDMFVKTVSQCLHFSVLIRLTQSGIWAPKREPFATNKYIENTRSWNTRALARFGPPRRRGFPDGVRLPAHISRMTRVAQCKLPQISLFYIKWCLFFCNFFFQVLAPVHRMWRPYIQSGTRTSVKKNKETTIIRRKKNV